MADPLFRRTMSLESPPPFISLVDDEAPSALSRAHTAHPVTDRDLLARLAQNDVSALDQVLARYWPSIVTYLAGLLNSGDAAEDVAQETFCRLWECRDRLRADGSLRGFLYQVAHNLAITEQRRARARAKSLDLMRAEGPRYGVPIDIGGDALDASLERAIGELPARRREILLLRTVHGLSYKEIARALGIAPQTVGNQFSAALSSLRRTLSHLLP
jgi:RNA polymerase sigma-70 factor, ECF subfamily